VRAASRAVSCGHTSTPAPVTPSIAMAHAALDSGNSERMRTALAGLLAAIETGQILPDADWFRDLSTLLASGSYAAGYSDAQAVA
jgi:hypothetical protein